jgi:hypothetical protein
MCNCANVLWYTSPPTCKDWPQSEEGSFLSLRPSCLSLWEAMGFIGLQFSFLISKQNKTVCTSLSPRQMNHPLQASSIKVGERPTWTWLCPIKLSLIRSSHVKGWEVLPERVHLPRSVELLVWNLLVSVVTSLFLFMAKIIIPNFKIRTNFSKAIF